MHDAFFQLAADPVSAVVAYPWLAAVLAFVLLPQVGYWAGLFVKYTPTPIDNVLLEIVLTVCKILSGHIDPPAPVDPDAPPAPPAPAQRGLLRRLFG